MVREKNKKIYIITIEDTILCKTPNIAAVKQNQGMTKTGFKIKSNFVFYFTSIPLPSQEGKGQWAVCNTSPYSLMITFLFPLA